MEKFRKHVALAIDGGGIKGLMVVMNWDARFSATRPTPSRTTATHLGSHERGSSPTAQISRACKARWTDCQADRLPRRSPMA